MRKVDTLLNEYAESHQTTFNKRIHYICVPAIFFSLIGLFLFVALKAQIDTFPLQNVVQKGHEKPVNCAVISPNGELLVTGGQDNVLKIWDVKLGYEIRSFHKHTAQIHDVNFSQDNNYIVSVGADKKVFVHHVVTGKLIQEIEVKEGKIWKAFFSADGKYIITSETPNNLSVWDVESGEQIHNLKRDYSDGITTQSISNNRSLIPHVASNSELRIIDFSTYDTISKVAIEDVYSYAFSPDDEFLAVGSSRLITTIIEVATGEIKHTLISDTIQRCNGCNTKVTYSKSGKYLASGSKNNGITVWNPNKGTKKNTIEINERPNHIEFSFDDHYLLVNCSRKLYVYETLTGKLVYELENRSLDTFYPRFSAFKNQIIIPTEYNTVSIVDVSNNKLVKTFKGYLNEDKKDGLGLYYTNWIDQKILNSISMKTSIALSPNDQWIARGNVDSTVFIIDTKLGAVKKKLTGHSKMVYLMKESSEILFWN